MGINSTIMKKIGVSLVLILFCGFIAQAQSSMFQFGIKGAFNYSTLKSDDNQWLSSENKSGYQVGIWTRIGNTFHVQPELYLTSKNSEVRFEDLSGAINQDNVAFTSLDLPVMIGTRVGIGGMGLRFQAGPLVSFVVDKDVGEALNQIIEVENYKDNAFSLVGGIGLDVGKFRADVRYEHAMSSLMNDSQPDQGLRVWTVGVGLRLF